MDQIEWRKIPNTIYSVSKCGQFRSDVTGKLKKQTPTRDGYVTVGLNAKTYLAHRIVAKVWLTDFDDNLTVCHLNHVRTDNRASNLMMATIGDNIRQSSSVGRYTHVGEKNNNCKIPERVITEIRELIGYGLKDREISELVSVQRRYVNMIRLGKKRRNG